MTYEPYQMNQNQPDPNINQQQQQSPPLYPRPNPYTPYQIPPPPIQSTRQPSSSSSSSSTWYSPAQPDRHRHHQQQPTQESSYNPLDHTRLSPSNFDPANFSTSSDFVLPRFAAGSAQYRNNDGPAVAENGGSSGDNRSGRRAGGDRDRSLGFNTGPSLIAVGGEREREGLMGHPPMPSRSSASQDVQMSYHSHQQQSQQSKSAGPKLINPVYDLYGSSVISIQPPTLSPLQISPYQDETSTPPSPSSPFDPQALGLPLPPPPPSPPTGNKPKKSNNWEGLYSSTGIDMIGILSRVVMRPNPQISIGPVDLDCSFLVVDAQKFDHPIVYASETFSRLTGYSNTEILGRNCRFLQSPEGIVEAGTKRQYTDGNAVYHLKHHISQRKESQASLINYYKGGKPFINLVTVIPISWGSPTNEITHFVGFQLDLVDQPAAILEKMKNGTYLVNYNISAQCVPRYPTNMTATFSKQDDPMEFLDDTWGDSTSGGNKQPGLVGFGSETGLGMGKTDGHHSAVVPPPFQPHDQESVGTLLDKVNEDGYKSLTTEMGKKQFNKLMLDNSDDLVHVLSLKGTILYLSPSASKLLQYEPGELVGKTLASICHPSDIVAVLRELKESGNVKTTGFVSILYRIRRKYSGFMWLEASGKLHVEHGKGRKCVILVGRSQKVYNVSWDDLESVGGLGSNGYWAKYSLDGMHLYSTPSVAEVTGYNATELVGTNVALMDEDGTFMKTLRNLATTVTTTCTSVTHKLKGKNGSVDVITHFYPSHVLNGQDRSFTVIAQTNLLSGEIDNHSQRINRASRSPSATPLAVEPRPSSAGNSPVAPPGQHSSDEDSSSGASSTSTSFSAVPSTFKTLSSSHSNNVFDELDTTRGTSWQFELHQLRLVNRKLREEKEALAALILKKRKRLGGAGYDGKREQGSQSCANCGRTSSPEWRSGPGGPRTLCNACGLRWAKVRSMSQSGGSTPSAGQGGGAGSPQESQPEAGSRQGSTSLAAEMVPQRPPPALLGEQLPVSSGSTTSTASNSFDSTATTSSMSSFDDTEAKTLFGDSFMSQ